MKSYIVEVIWRIFWTVIGIELGVLLYKLIFHTPYCF